MFSETHTPKSLRQVLTQYCTPPEDLIRDFENSARLVQVEKGSAVARQGRLSHIQVLSDIFQRNNTRDIFHRSALQLNTVYTQKVQEALFGCFVVEE